MPPPVICCVILFFSSRYFLVEYLLLTLIVMVQLPICAIQMPFFRNGSNRLDFQRKIRTPEVLAALFFGGKHHDVLRYCNKMLYSLLVFAKGGIFD
jgi:hypothetical protein